MFEHKIAAHRPKIATYRPKPPIKKPIMYLETNRKCCRCGSNKTYDKVINRIQWYRDIDENGKWAGKWLCSKCYHKESYERRNRENDLMREMIIKMKGR